jgi:hypothetical protein
MEIVVAMGAHQCAKRSTSNSLHPPEAMLLSRAGSCHWDWESRDSTPWKLSTAALLATSTSMVENLKWRSSQRWRPKISNPFLNFKVVFHLGWTSATHNYHRQQHLHIRNREQHNEEISMESHKAGKL